MQMEAVENIFFELIKNRIESHKNVICKKIIKRDRQRTAKATLFSQGGMIRNC